MPTDSTTRISGNCLCGAVSLTMIPDRPVVACHCNQGRKQTGHFVAATRTANDQLTLSGADNITWYASSDNAERGFCRHCGSILFCRNKDSTSTSVMAGCLKAPTGLVVERHIHTRDKGDYYQIDPEALCFPQSD